jgi:hypothetical protein
VPSRSMITARHSSAASEGLFAMLCYFPASIRTQLTTARRLR